MFAGWKQRLEEKKAKNKAIAESRYWKEHALLQKCLQAMRGSCTVAPMEMHEAAVAAANIALQEGSWTDLEERLKIPADFLGEMVYIVWEDDKIPVLKAPWALAVENLHDILAVAFQTLFVSETLDRIVWFDGHGHIKLYFIA